jgi:hypothetical protein
MGRLRLAARHPLTKKLSEPGLPGSRLSFDCQQTSLDESAIPRAYNATQPQKGHTSSPGLQTVRAA